MEGAEQKRCGVRLGRADVQAPVARSAVFRKTGQVRLVTTPELAGWLTKQLTVLQRIASAASSTLTVISLGPGTTPTPVLQSVHGVTRLSFYFLNLLPNTFGFILLLLLLGARGSVVLETLCYRPESREFET
jgi:hypothetical protein